MSGLRSLGTLVDAQRERRAAPKGKPHQIVKQEKAQAKEDKAEKFRAAIWKRDEGRCRATGVSLVKSGTVDATRLGEVDHSIPRSLAPDRIYDTSNGLLLQKFLNRLRKAACLHAPEHRYFNYSGPDNRALQQTFVWRDDDGKITKTRKG